MKKLVFSSITALTLVSGSAFAQGGSSTTAQPDPKLAAQCQKVIPTIQKAAESILKIKESAKRKIEFEKLGKTIPKGCEPFIQPLAQEISAKEKAMYPDQPVASAPGSNNQQGQANNGGQQNQQGQPNPGGQSSTAAQPGSMGQPDPKLAAQCQKVIPTIQKTAENILKIKESAKRKIEFEKLGKTIPQGCEPFMQPLAQEIMAKEKAMYPDQPVASAPGSNNQQGQANNGGQQGQSNQGGQSSTAAQPGSMGQPDPKLAEKCQKVIPTIQKTAENILKIKESAKRKIEFEKLGKAIPQGCEPFIQPLAQEISAKEKAMYPDQPVASAPGSNNQQGQANNGGQSGQPMNTGSNNSSTGQAKPVDLAACEKARPMVAKEADLCLKVATEDKRRACFEMIGKKFPQGCEQAYEGMKQEVAAKEKSLYPTQGSAIP